MYSYTHSTFISRKLTVLVKMLVEQKHIHDLVVDKFGNYFLQTLLSNVDEVSFNMLVVTLTEDSNRFSELCTHQFGSHVVQAAINMSGGNVRSSALLATSLCDNIESIAKHFLGSICLIHAIDSLVPSAGFKPIFSSHWQSLSLSRHGHVVMIHALDRYDDDFLYTVGDLTLNSLESFISDDFGYRVLLHLLKQLQVRRLSQTAFVSKLVGLIKFNAKYFRIIEYLVLNFPENVQVKKTLIPTIAKIVRKGFVPILSNN